VIHVKRALLIIAISVFALSALAAPKSWKQMAMDAIMQGDYQTAAVHYRKWVEADPTDAVSLYNLACCEAMLKRPDEAMRALRMSSEAGWSDSSHTARDSDLESLRSREDFKALLSDIARNARTRHGGYTGHVCRQERVGEYLMVLPEEYDPARRYPLVILLHGLGSSPEQFAQVTAFINTHDYIYALPQGPYTARDSDGKGFSHFRERDDFSDDVSSVAAAADWVVRVADDVGKRYPVADSTFWIIGFSQGGALAHITAAYHPARVAGYCAHAGFFIKNAISPAQLAAEARAGVKALLTHGVNDPAVPLLEAVYALNQLKQAGVDARLEQMDVPHRFTAEVGLKVNDWLKEKMGK
jgi:predicted esterase